MDAQLLAGIAGVILSLLFSYVPGLNSKFAALDQQYKRLIMLALLLLSAACVYGLACAGLGADFGIAVTCDKAGLLNLVKIFIAAAIANQATYAISPLPAVVRKLKSA